MSPPVEERRRHPVRGWWRAGLLAALLLAALVAAHSAAIGAKATKAADPFVLPGAILIADRGNDRIMLVDQSGRQLWLFPTLHDQRRGLRLNFNDDSFVGFGGTAIVANEEEAHTIVSINIRTHHRIHLFGTPGVRGSGSRSS